MTKHTIKLIRSYYKHPNVEDKYGYYIYYTNRFDEKSTVMMNHIYNDNQCTGQEIDVVKQLAECHGWDIQIVDKEESKEKK